MAADEEAGRSPPPRAVDGLRPATCPPTRTPRVRHHVARELINETNVGFLMPAALDSAALRCCAAGAGFDR
jgi:hypothetical protein